MEVLFLNKSRKAAAVLRALTGDLCPCTSSPRPTQGSTRTSPTTAAILALSALGTTIRHCATFGTGLLWFDCRVFLYHGCPLLSSLSTASGNGLRQYTVTALKIIHLQNNIPDILSGTLCCRRKAQCSGKYGRKGHANSCGFVGFFVGFFSSF